MGDVVVIAVLAKMSPEELDRCLQQLTELAPLVGDHAHTLEHAHTRTAAAAHLGLAEEEVAHRHHHLVAGIDHIRVNIASTFRK